MKKSLIFAASVAVMGLAVSCAKSEIETTLSEPHSLTLSAEMTSLEQTKLSFKDAEKKELYWNTGDALRLITQDAIPATKKSSTDCGYFTTSDNNTKTASFSGTIPAGAVGDKYGLAIFPADRYVTSAFSGITGGGYYMSVQVNIPAEQDGTGLKYMQGVAKLKDGKLGQLFWTSAMFRLVVPSGHDIRKITLSIPPDSGKCLVCDHNLYFKNDDGTVSSITTSQKGTLLYSVTVSKGGEELSGEQFITVRNGDKNVEYTLTFYNSSDAVIKTFKFSSPSKAGVSYGKLYNLGDFTEKF